MNVKFIFVDIVRCILQLWVNLTNVDLKKIKIFITIEQFHEFEWMCLFVKKQAKFFVSK